MNNSEFDLVVGIHSIAHALKNPNRKVHEIVLSEEGESELIKRGGILKTELSKYPIKKVSGHKVQELAKKYFRIKNIDYQRVPSQIFLIASELSILTPADFYNFVSSSANKILCLDQITDVHNAGAIIRTASFYGVDAVVFPGKRSFGMTPSFFRISSGAAEYVKMVAVNNLSRIIAKLNELNVKTIGLSENAEKPFHNTVDKDQKICLVLGKEDTGISNAVMRQVKYQIKLSSLGEIHSLNVASAAAISMEKCFG